ncbi:hypothetical protein O1Q96_35845 [Streptomyces sp. Qhu-G9]|uniref:hypothetical protein n=1 Tax=Streptomyces sp. Qhu-G9 TaxID=3452799 RepID=UPI0022AC2880|nr:hypothetical protein [Streptomyces aurantiacus]WAU84597.1 hypothetical protein O1Q96_35845 [Streptomyces aurantiacus]
MLALRLARSAHPAVQFRRLLVAAASAGTGFLLLCTLGYAMGHPDASAAAVLRLAWCLAPLAATVQFAVAVARTDPATRPRPGLSAIGLGPGRLMVLAAVSTAVSCTLGSMVALLFFLHLRGDLTGLPFDGDAAGLLAADESLPLPAALTLLALVPVIASVAGAVVLRPRDHRPAGRPGGRPGRLGGFGGYGRSTERVGFGAYGRFGARGGARTGGHADGVDGPGQDAPGALAQAGAAHARSAHGDLDEHAARAGHNSPGAAATTAGLDVPRRSAARTDSRALADTHTSSGEPVAAGSPPHDGLAAPGHRGAPQHPRGPGGQDRADRTDLTGHTDRTGLPHHPGRPGHPLDPHHPLAPLPAPTGLPWGAAVLAAGLAVETYAGRTAPAADGTALPGGLTGGPLGVLVGWALTAIGLALAGPAITHLCGRLLQAVRPGALRLLAGRVLMEEATRVGRPLGVVCAVASGAYAMAVLHTGTRPDVGPLTTLGALLVAGCAVATLLTAAVEARNARADTTAALLRIGAPATTLRAAAALRAGILLAVLGPLTWVIAELAALPLAH